jgi:hypothetical protein
METFRHLERHQVRISDVSNSSHMHPLNPPSTGLGLPSRVQFIIGSSFRPEKFSTSALTPRVFHRVKLFSTSETPSFHLSPFRLRWTSPSAAGASQPPRYHPTRNFVLAITPIPEGRRQQRITSSGEQCRLCEAPQDHIIRAPLSAISLQSLLRLPNRSLASLLDITLPTLWPSAKA